MERYFNYSRLSPQSAEPARNCTITVYDKGTLNLASIFADDNLTPTPKSNPFTADDSGFFFFYAPNGRYDIRLSGGGIVTPFTWGDVYLNGTPSFDFNVLDYGYVVDSAVNNTPAITAAIAAATAAGGGTVWLPTGRAGVQAQIYVPDNVWLRGMGPGTILSRMSPFTGGLATIRANGAFVNVTDLAIEQNNVAGDGILVSNGNYGRVERVNITEVASGAGIAISQAGSNLFSDLWIQGSSGIRMETGVAVSTSLTFRTVNIDSTSTTLPAVRLEGAINCRWFDGQLSCRADGFQIEDCAGVYIYGLYAERVNGAANTYLFHVVDGSDDIAVYSGLFGDTLGMADPVVLIGSNVSRTLFEGCQFGREYNSANPLVQINTPALGTQTHTMRNCSFRNPISYTSVRVTGTQPAQLDLLQLMDRGAGGGTLDLHCLRSSIMHTGMNVTLSAGSSRVLIVGSELTTLTDPSNAATLIGCRTDGIDFNGVPATGLGYLEGEEISLPGAPGPDKFRLFALDNGSGKTQIVARFNTGAVQVIATEP